MTPREAVEHVRNTMTVEEVVGALDADQVLRLGKVRVPRVHLSHRAELVERPLEERAH